MGILDEIVRKKRERLAAAKSEAPLRELREKIRETEGTRDFRGAVRASPESGIRLIAEVKRASPSAGIIREDFDPRGIALVYRERADAISVLTEEDFFQGRLDYISTVRKASGKPVLRKDFIFDEYQLYEARAAGADAVLLIEELLDSSQAEECLHLAAELGMAVLFEVHDARGLERAMKTRADIIGINNRDLTTMEVSVDTTFALRKEIPPRYTVVSESGIRTRQDVLRLQGAGVDAMLIGTTFMRARDIAAKMVEILGENRRE